MEVNMKNSLHNSLLMKRNKPRNEDIRGAYFRDLTAIIHSMPFRRLKNKTQVIFAPSNDHICTRIEHVLHVSTIAKTICVGLQKKGWTLDSDLALTIGFGHDLGHAPFGHAGEQAINEYFIEKQYQETFLHEINGYRIVEDLCNEGEGLNLTYAVKDGIMFHNGEGMDASLVPDQNIKDLSKIKEKGGLPSTFEGCIVRISDKIAYIGRDLEDAVTSDLIEYDDIPNCVKQKLGTKNGEIIDTLILDVIESSNKNNVICFSDEIYSIFKELREFNYHKIYTHPRIVQYKLLCSKGIKRIINHLEHLYDNFGRNYTRYENSFLRIDRKFGSYLSKMERKYEEENTAPIVRIVDYVSGMTDTYALDCMKQIHIPEPFIFT